MQQLGLALSGGGSRAAAFHCGTLRALERLKLVPQVDVVSTVSGGSVFAAAWAASLTRAEKTDKFIVRMQAELHKGFILRALLTFPWLLGLLPTYPRTKMLAKVFNKLTSDLTLGGLPGRPAFVLNTTVLNSGQVGKFVREGFSAAGLGPRPPTEENPTVPCTTFPVALAAAASAAFPVGLPPVLLSQRKWFPNVEMVEPLKGHKTLALTDGGVLENLGVQPLLKSRRFSTRDIIASDAGTRDLSWRPGNPLYWLRSLVIWLASGSILERFSALMNDKQNRWMRQRLFETATSPVPRPTDRRNVLLVRLAADWNDVVGGAARARLQELFKGEVPDRLDASGVLKLLEAHHPDRAGLLSEAKNAYEELPLCVRKLNEIGTNFTRLTEVRTKALAQHAYWQTLATFALYWEPWPVQLSPTSRSDGNNPVDQELTNNGIAPPPARQLSGP